MGRQNYDPAEIEPRWQEFWEENEVFRVPDLSDPDFDADKPKYYVLDMFPYPSGAGLHVGHAEGYTATDIVARYKRMRNFYVMHPMGWDAFGLPAEQHAIKTGTHPTVSTGENIENFRRQMKALGFSYDWGREFATTDPDYFRWTQWIFAQLFDRGLAYMAEVPVWWCPAMGTVLANEEVINGRSERGDHPCERRPLKQWMLKITDYAERLLEDLDDLDWPESVKTMQREWIGRSEGAEIVFRVAGCDAEIPVFTTRPDTLFGASFMVLAPEHPLVARIISDTQEQAVAEYVQAAATKSELDRTDLAVEMTGVCTGAFALNPLFDPGDPRARLPIWIADYVIVTYGTGAIMAVPAGDERDFRFATKFELPIPPIFSPQTGDPERDALVREGRVSFANEAAYINSSNNRGLDLTGLDMAAGKRAVIEWLQERGAGTAKVTYRLRDWLFSRQRYWGEPFPVLHGEDGAITRLPDDALPLTLPDMDDFEPSGRPEPPLAKAEEWVNTVGPDGRPAKRETNTMPNWAGSCWYYLRFLDPKNNRALVSVEAERYWMPVDLYIGGVEHAVLHLLYARFWHKVLYDLGVVSTLDPFQKLYNQGMILSFAYQDARGAIVPVTEAEKTGDGFRHKRTGEPLEQVVAKMSKALHNVVNPDEVIREYGADALRLYEMYMGPLADSKVWNPRDVPGVRRFLARVWRLVVPEDESNGPLHEHLSSEGGVPDPELERSLHQTIHKVGGDIERLAFNTAIAAMMIFVNEATKRPGVLTRSQALRFVAILGPFSPHIAEELWSRLRGEGLLSREPWPEVEQKWLRADRVEMAVQVNGKVRGKISVRSEATDAEILEQARDAVVSHLTGKEVVKEILVRGRLVNLVTRQASG